MAPPPVVLWWRHGQMLERNFGCIQHLSACIFIFNFTFYNSIKKSRPRRPIIGLTRETHTNKGDDTVSAKTMRYCIAEGRYIITSTCGQEKKRKRKRGNRCPSVRRLLAPACAPSSVHEGDPSLPALNHDPHPTCDDTCHRNCGTICGR